jgi:hypothetical protein
VKTAAAILALLTAEALRSVRREAPRRDRPPPAARQVDFAEDVKPVLDRACLRCHFSPQPKPPNRRSDRGGFSLSTRAEALRGGSNIGVVIVPGRSAESPLIHLVAGYEHQKTQVSAMPPQEKGRLSKVEVGVLRAWIDQGAVWPE